MKNDDFFELFHPEVFKTNLILSSIFIAYFENTTDYLIEQPRTLFTNGFTKEKGDIIDEKYKTDVLALHKKSITASLLWFKNQEAIDQKDIDLFDELRRYRNKLSHELLKLLLEKGINTQEFADKLTDLFQLRIKIEKWWILNFEIYFSDIETDKPLTENDVTSGGEMIYTLILDLISGDPEKANYYYNTFKSKMGK